MPEIESRGRFIDIADDQAGLRELAARMGSAILAKPETEPFIDPAVARHWLVVQTERAVLQDDGSVKLRKDSIPDHLGFAAIVIATGNEPRLFSEVYTEVLGDHSPIHPGLVLDIARNMVEDYYADPKQ